MPIPRDKLLHLAAGAGISLVVALATTAPWLGAAAAAAAAIGKEVHDHYRQGRTVDLLDAAATARAGALVAAIVGAIGWP